jgi:alpha-ketoglutarate-dependent taurine dioxygenase
MEPPTRSTEQIRQSLVEQIAAITTMQPGTLAEEYREHPSPDGKSVVRRGPYFKHQCWHDGRNLSRRVPVIQAAQLRQDIDNAKLFGQLTAQLGQLNIQHTLALRTAEASTVAEVRDAKKNSTHKRASGAPN